MVGVLEGFGGEGVGSGVETGGSVAVRLAVLTGWAAAVSGVNKATSAGWGTFSAAQEAIAICIPVRLNSSQILDRTRADMGRVYQMNAADVQVDMFLAL